MNIRNPDQPSAVDLDTTGGRVETLLSPSVVPSNNFAELPGAETMIPTDNERKAAKYH